MIYASVPIVLGAFTSILTGVPRQFVFWFAVAIFVLLILILIAKWGALFSSIGLIITVAYPFIYILAAVVGLILRYIYEEATA